MLRVKQQGVPHALLDITAQREQEATPATGLFDTGLVTCTLNLKMAVYPGTTQDSLAVKGKSEENCAFDDKSTIFGTEIIEILRNIF